MLQASKIQKSFNELQVLKGIDLEVQKGELVSIVGASGAGKSTLLHILGTLVKPDAGSLKIDGESLEGLSSKSMAAFRNKKIGFVFQFHNLLPEFTAIENAGMPGFIAGHSKKDVLRRSETLLEILGLSDRLEHKPSEMSGGEQQRVSVARALYHEPSIVFADEPSGNLDSKNASYLHDLLFKMRDDLGQTLVVVTHNLELAEMADRRLTIQDGLIAS